MLTMILLVADIVIAGVGVWSEAKEVALIGRVLHGERITLQQATSNDDRQRAVGVGMFGLTGLTAIAWLAWQHRGQENLPALGARGTRFTPGWAVGWWFVPIANLVRPVQAVGELVRASDPAGKEVEWKGRPVPVLVWTWWTALVGSRVLAIVATAIGGQDATLDAHRTADQLNQLTLAIDAVGGLLAIALIGRVLAAQRARAAGLAAPPT